jgi:5-methylcytosine-specific restriction endonuclease McrA
MLKENESICVECSRKIDDNKETKWIGGKCIDKEYQKVLWQKQGNLKRARKRNALGHFTIQEWELLKRQYHHKCPSCGRTEPDIKLTVDHIVPLTKNGTNWIWNIQPLCLECNMNKKQKTIKFSKKTKGQAMIVFEKGG